MKVRILVAVLASVLSAEAGYTQSRDGEAPFPLGSVSLPRRVMADGKVLNAGSYQVRLTAPVAAGQETERWVEFVRGGKVMGREVASIVPAAEMKNLQPGPSGAAQTRAGARVEMLKGNEYLRVWINRAGVNYLIHMPPAAM